jgi:DHA1 family bicyclomycin/chloramphenicol resistance-like MFS transporter
MSAAIVTLAAIALPETLPKQRRDPGGHTLRTMRRLLTQRSFLGYALTAGLAFGALYAYISGSPFVLQDIYGQSAFDFGLAFAVGSVGYMGGSALAAKFVGRYGIGTVSGFGAAAAAIGGLLMVGAVAFDLRSGFALVLPMALYLAGMGGVLGQAIAGAMQPYHDRAGAASSLLGFIQQSVSAVVGVAIGHMLGDSAMPMAAGIALCGAVTFAIWLTTRGVRARGLRH